MGLDGVELVMATEDAFGVRIEDAEAEICFHPFELTDLVFSKVKSADDSLCHSQRAFYIARKALVETFGVPRSSVKLGEPLFRYIPVDDQPESWCRLKDAMNVEKWPDLVRPEWMTRLIVLSGFIVFLGICLFLPIRYPSISWFLTFPVGVVAWIGLYSLLMGLTLRWKTRIPILSGNVGQLMELAYTSERMEWTREGVATVVKKVVMETLGVAEEQYWEDADFVKDYGV